MPSTVRRKSSPGWAMEGPTRAPPARWMTAGRAFPLAGEDPEIVGIDAAADPAVDHRQTRRVAGPGAVAEAEDAMPLSAPPPPRPRAGRWRRVRL